jgi:tRNA-Thr(GGU) m(6)t(6)A37 methyltransferase TsaA
MATEEITLRPVGHVASSLVDRASAPCQGDEGAPESWLLFEPGLEEALATVEAGTDMLVFTWLDRGDRSVLSVHPRGDPDRPREGVFTTRSPDRPNPIGLHCVRVLEVDGLRVRVADLEALDGTPVLDLKPVLGGISDR